MDNPENKKVVVRIPPSPTGYFHVGRARTALFNYLFAKKHGGTIVFRIEDTDKERSKKEYEDDIIDALAWLGITYDGGPFRQSERGDIYKKYIQKMLDDGTAYISQETEGENKEVIRFKNPNKTIVFNDLIRGDISFDTTELKDFVIARNIDDPLYHLTVVVDDHEMGITHVIRGDDGISNTPRQILLQEAIGATRPIYAHVPLILAADKSKMSARHGATSLRDFRAMGYLPEAMVNFLGLLGFNPGGERELYTLAELVEVFDLARVQKGGAVFNTEKLNWFNKEYIKKLPFEIQQKEIAGRLAITTDKLSPKICTIILERVEKWSDIEPANVAYLFEQPQYEKELLYWKNENNDEKIKEKLQKVLEIFESANDTDFETADSVKNLIWDYAEEQGRGAVLWPLRVTLSGLEKSPDPFTLASTFGKIETISRIQKAISLL